MKIPFSLAAVLLLGFTIGLPAATTINASNYLAYGGNIGWIGWHRDLSHGAIIGEYVCSGHIWSANTGWIKLGSGSPTNGIYYQNLSINDFGVNHDGFGNLRGHAWGANIGWINFENTGAPRVDLRTGNLTGYIYSPNCGWISLSNTYAYVQTDSIAPAPTDSNGLPMPWQLQNFGTLGIDAKADPDGDGISNLDEYLAGTDPNDPNSVLAITHFTTAPGGITATFTWSSVPNRFYSLYRTFSIDSWSTNRLGPIQSDGAATSSTITDTNAPMRYYRIQAVRPLSP